MTLLRLLLTLLCLLVALSWLPRAEAAGQTSIVGSYAIADWPECTWWAWRMRPDLQGVIYGDAWDWGREARLAGYRVTTYPVAGSVAVFQPGVQGAWGRGHVAYVQSVSGGWAYVSELNWWPFTTVVHYRWIHAGWGVSFIGR